MIGMQKKTIIRTCMRSIRNAKDYIVTWAGVDTTQTQRLEWFIDQRLARGSAIFNLTATSKTELSRFRLFAGN